jgi:hypothetical protein
VTSKPAPAPEATVPPSASLAGLRTSSLSPELPPRTAARIPPPQVSPPAPTPGTIALQATVGYHPLDRLASVQPGDSKDKVFGLLATSFERQNGSLVRIEGIRLRASARSPRHDHAEIAEARLGESPGATPYWFLFGDGSLIAWGRPDEWAAAAARLQVESEYAPDASRAGQDRANR